MVKNWGKKDSWYKSRLETVGKFTKIVLAAFTIRK